MKPVRIRALERAKQFVGVKEQPPGSNRGPYNPIKRGGIDFWQRRTNGLVGYPWCAAFVFNMFLDVGKRIPVPLPALVESWEAWSRSAGTAVTRPFRGDVVCYDWNRNDWSDHIGFVDRVLALRWRNGRFVGWLRTIEGNTSAGNNSNGGQVQVRYRWVNDKTRFVRILG